VFSPWWSSAPGGVTTKRVKESVVFFMNTDILGILREGQEMRLRGGLYHQTQVKLCYNSNRISGLTPVFSSEGRADPLAEKPVQ
jgi:hypothetical protein